LSRFTVQALERYLERKLRSAEALARLGGRNRPDFSLISRTVKIA
jgi:hypothetical protein